MQESLDKVEYASHMSEVHFVDIMMLNVIGERERARTLEAIRRRQKRLARRRKRQCNQNRP